MPSVHASNFGSYTSESGNASEGSVLRRSVRQFFNNLKKEHITEVNKDLNMFYNKVLYNQTLLNDKRLDQIAEDLFVAKYVLMYAIAATDIDTIPELPTFQNKVTDLIADFDSKLIAKADLDTFEKGLDEVYDFIGKVRAKHTSLPVYILNSNLIAFYKKHVTDILKVAQEKPAAKATVKPSATAATAKPATTTKPTTTATAKPAATATKPATAKVGGTRRRRLTRRRKTRHRPRARGGKN